MSVPSALRAPAPVNQGVRLFVNVRQTAIRQVTLQSFMNKDRSLTALFIAAILAVLPPQGIAQVQEQITLAQLEQMFSNMRAKTNWNVDGPLLWGYFFFDPNPEKLKRANAELEALGYRTVNLEKVDGAQIFRLHVERVEIHTPATLNSRNLQFYALAKKHGVESYDGMDVGPAPVK